MVLPFPQHIQLLSNGTGTFTFADLAGNSGSVDYAVTNIDTAKILADVTYTPFTPTSGDVLAEVYFNKSGVVITNTNFAPCEGGETEVKNKACTFTGNATFTFTFQDIAGNTGSKEAKVTRIDKQAPIATITYSPNVLTYDSVVATVTLNETGTVEGRQKINATTSSKTYSDNATGEVYFYDAVGNRSFTTFTISWIMQYVGGGSLSKDRCPSGDFSPSYYDGSCGVPPSSGEEESSDENEHSSASEQPVSSDEEGYGIYERAKANALTSMPTYEAFRSDDVITRAEMAKVIVKYAKMTPPTLRATSSVCTFTDLDQAPADLQPFIVQACVLGLMGYYSDGITIKSSFSPNDFLTRAEVGVILSRLLRGNKYAGTEENWYRRHLQALREEEIMQYIDAPMMQELRGNVFLMLMRISGHSG
jgi:hypothetical protein